MAAQADRSGQPASSTAFPKAEMPCEDPHSLSTEIKKEEDSPEEEPESLTRDQPSEPFQEAREYAPFAPDNVQPHVAESYQNPEITLATVLSEVRTVKDECSRIRSIVEQVSAHHIELLKNERSHVTAQVTTRQNGMTSRLTQLEGQLHDIAFNQHTAVESKQEIRMVVQEFQIRAHEMDRRLQEMSSIMQSVTREAHGFSQQDFPEESKKTLFNAQVDLKGSLLMQEASIASVKTAFREWQQKCRQLQSGQEANAPTTSTNGQSSPRRQQ